MSDNLHPRPMRLGTRSCAECRRRKVRCIFPAATEGRTSCRQCGMRGTACTAQQSPMGQSARIGQPDGLLSLGEERLEKRLAEIEVKVRDVWVSLAQGTASSGLSSSTAGLPKNGLPRTASIENEHANAGAEDRSLSRCITTTMHPDAALATAATPPDPAEDIANNEDLDFPDAPLLVLVKAASMTNDPQASPSIPSATPQTHTTVDTAHILHVPEHLMLQDDDLLTLLAATEQYWPIWPPWQYGAHSSTMWTLQNGGVRHAAHFLSQALRSSSRTIAAKALLWLSLCIHQAPRTLQLASCALSQPALLTLYMQTADTLLTSATDKRELLDAIEARLIQQKLYVDKGCPRQAWLCVRRAADAALLLRLHRAADRKEGRKEAGGGLSREEAIYTEIWQLETSLTLILGLPSTMPAPIYDNNDSDIPLRAFHRRLFTLAASVVTRNQTPQPDYTTTQHISRELDACRTIMPASFWNDPPPNQPFAQLYAQQATKIQYFLIAKLLHLPFMFSADVRHRESRSAAVAAARGLITAYIRLRRSSQDDCGGGWGWGLFVVCESLEFQAFSAGITLLIRLLSHDIAEEDGGGDSEDWSLIESLTASLRRTTDVMRCDVASQAAEVLGLLTQVARGEYRRPERYDAVLPYFGKVSIVLRGAPSKTTRAGLEKMSPSLPSFGVVEFSAHPHDISHFSGGEQGEGQLGGDWAVMAADLEVGLDWTQSFTFGNDCGDSFLS